MAMRSYISAAAPMSQDSPISASRPPLLPSAKNPMRQPTKIILPDKKPMKWSTGVAPGEYGGPPTTTKLRKYWGGPKDDPVTSSDLIWNRDFMPELEKLVQPQPQSQSSPPPQVIFSLSFFFFFFFFLVLFRRVV
uniref:Uncharacterized protein n=1 Tax=Opuntia streptacantha TaxID=393608 RepID=A0A7C8YGF2_OPUST